MSKIITDANAKIWVRVSRLDWLTADEAALYCRVSPTTFEGMIPALGIPVSRPAGPKGNRRFFRADLDKALLSTRQPAA